jgi:large subunit ribosomal protein L23
MKPIHQILIAPHITEQTSKDMFDVRAGVYTYAFKVALDANKIEIRNAIEQRFGVKVDSVNTLVVRGKVKRVRYAAGKRSNWKKAYIKLKPGHKIGEFEGV